LYPNAGVLPEWTSDYTAFEAPDPLYWTKHGYAVIVADCPGTWYGEGNEPKVTYTSPEEAEFFYDLIEWAGVQDWSSGLVGLSGVSYLALMQVSSPPCNGFSEDCSNGCGAWQNYLPHISGVLIRTKVFNLKRKCSR
jgi:hypothetical protein